MFLKNNMKYNTLQVLTIMLNFCLEIMDVQLALVLVVLGLVRTFENGISHLRKLILLVQDQVCRKLKMKKYIIIKFVINI